MEKAGLLLQNTDLSVNEIALEVGYQSYSHFHKIFKKWYRQTPNDYRQHYSPEIAMN
ncbi:helix-turn-helix domain-containing protein [Enterococcus asini]